MVRIETQDLAPDDSGGARLSGDARPDQDPVRSLHDTEEEAGDEIGLTDIYSIDTVEARQLRVALDAAGDEEAELD